MNTNAIAIDSIREAFPTLDQSVHDKPLVYLDSAASSQMPQTVIDVIVEYQSQHHANVHRGVHALSHRATDIYESARKKTASFINAASTNEIVFTSGTTESINLVANSFARSRLGPGKRIVVTHMEHHSNIVPWQMICEQTGATLSAVAINPQGELDTQDLYQQLDDSVALLAIGHVSNALGTINDINTICQRAHDKNIPVLVDGAQAVAHMPVDVQAIDCDFYAFSAHKMYGPTGTGVLYAKQALLDAMPPWKGGGEMILEVSIESSSYNELPYKFEAGTPNISGVAGLGAAIDFIQSVGISNIEQHGLALSSYLTEQLVAVNELRLIGEAENKTGVQSFLLADIHPHDLGTILDHHGVAIRTGHHCAMPVMTFYQIPGTARASLGVYSNKEDVDRLIEALDTAYKLFKA